MPAAALTSAAVAVVLGGLTSRQQPVDRGSPGQHGRSGKLVGTVRITADIGNGQCDSGITNFFTVPESGALQAVTHPPIAT